MTPSPEIACVTGLLPGPLQAYRYVSNSWRWADAHNTGSPHLPKMQSIAQVKAVSTEELWPDQGPLKTR